MPPNTATEPPARRLALPDRYDFSGTVASVAMSRHDPCVRIAAGAWWWATRTPVGPATLRLARDGDALLATGYGAGAAWVVEQADAVAGLRDDLTGFAELAASHPVVAQLARTYSGVRLPATGRVFQRLLRTVFEQKVTGKEAYRAYAATVRHFHRISDGEPAPGPVAGVVPGLLLPPEPEAVAATPYWVFHPFGVEQRRADTLCRAAAVAEQLERCPDAATLTTRLTAIPGIGPWTAAEVTRVVFGDPDAVSVGDFHIPHMVSWALAGQARAGSRIGAPGQLSPADRRMLELLAPFRGHRGRVCVLLEKAGLVAPAFGPRAPIRSFASF
ncbi:MAG TPA: DNA-3-methyladenine glycosylase 2 family protein [Micromonosporaceae bacterium]